MEAFYLNILQQPEFTRLIKMIDKAKNRLIKQGYDHEQIQDILFMKMFGKSCDRQFKKLDDTNGYYAIKKYIPDKNSVEYLLQFYNNIVIQKNEYNCEFNEYYDLLSYKLNLSQSSSSPSSCESSQWGSDEDQESIKINPLIKREILNQGQPNNSYLIGNNRKKVHEKYSRVKKRKNKDPDTKEDFMSLGKKIKINSYGYEHPDPNTGCLWDEISLQPITSENQPQKFSYDDDEGLSDILGIQDSLEQVQQVMQNDLQDQVYQPTHQISQNLQNTKRLYSKLWKQNFIQDEQEQLLKKYKKEF